MILYIIIGLIAIVFCFLPMWKDELTPYAFYFSLLTFVSGGIMYFSGVDVGLSWLIWAFTSAIWWINWKIL